MRSAVQVLKGVKAEIPQKDEALTREGERPANTRYTTVKDRTAVIDVYGAIIPRANFFSEWSGGASCELLAKDLKWAVADEDIDNIVLSIHSPGGEVTGVSELAETIYQSRDKKNITAYVSGMGCSAAYWLASACSTVIANPTSILGSIGVMSVYLDDSKAMEQAGLEEIEFISSQSPFKNADPKSAEGKKRIQARVDSLAEVFITSVAKYRGVETAKVMKDFGKGDVFVGEEAVKAGLADRIANFSEIFQDSTLAVDISNTGETMANEKQPQAEQVTLDKTEFEKLQAQLAGLTAMNEKLEADRLESRINETVKGFQGETTKHKTVLSAIAKALGEDSAEFKAYVELQTALSAQIEASTLFTEAGSAVQGGVKSALERLNEKAEAIAKAKGISALDAFNEAVEANPDLYTAYNAERQEAK